ncbi:uncharacterized protein N7496_012679 [Penicillium cataractarum]|uniref:Stc1 domain-containing protein n=1 Tax=Penicillium cataractarum TaxID=2100454 RepID=A0A9W9US95_9EURO|nr:uncharacterized protein N7496_012679 [Penicillium cataractarum]KAJ5355467.1 hypothetical protein N7496_012679 [Penicillium cataractarum]
MPRELAPAKGPRKPEQLKNCTRCKRAKPLGNFNLEGSSAKGTARTCLQCRQWHRVYTAARRAKSSTSKAPVSQNLLGAQETSDNQPLTLERPIPVDAPLRDPGMEFTEAQKRALMQYFAS